jgi:hypothetical protein
MAAPRTKFGYNDYGARPDDETYVRPKTSFISPQTQRALEELEMIQTWAEFAAICERQKAKRGY